MAEVNIVAQDMRVDQLPYVLPAVVGLEIASQKLRSNLGHLRLYNFLFLFTILAVPDVANKQAKSADRIVLFVSHFH